MTPAIRMTTERDFEILIEIYRACFAEPPWFESFTPEEVRTDFERMLGYPDGVFLTTENDGEILGAAVAYCVRHKPEVAELVPEDKRDGLYLAELFVKPSARRRGLGEALVRARLTLAASRGFTDAVVRTSADQTIIIGLYARLGFEIVSFQDVVSRKWINGVERDVPDRRVVLLGKIEP